MNIYGHLIKKELIIGISPLFHKENPDTSFRNTIRPVQLSFDIHTANRSIEIKSDWFNVGHKDHGLRPDQKEARKLYIAWQDTYYEIRKEIAAFIGESLEEQTKFDDVPAVKKEDAQQQ